jgi:hypothetical protein
MPEGRAMDDAGAVDPRDALLEVESLRRRVRADRHALSLPLMVMGLVALGGALTELFDALRTSSGPGFVYWALAVPIGFNVLAVIEWGRSRHRA